MTTKVYETHRVVSKVVTPAWRKRAARRSWMKKFIPFVFAALVAVMFPSVATGQVVVLPTSYQLRFYPTTGPVENVALAAANYVCNLSPTAPVPAGTQVYAAWDDPRATSMDCRYYDSGTGAFSQKVNRRFNIAVAGCAVVEGVVECGDESNRHNNYIYRVLPSAPTGFSVPTPSQASISGTLGPIVPNWIFPNQPGWRLVTFNGPFGPFQMMAGGNNEPGVVNLPGFTVRTGQQFEIVLVQP